MVLANWGLLPIVTAPGLLVTAMDVDVKQAGSLRLLIASYHIYVKRESGASLSKPKPHGNKILI